MHVRKAAGLAFVAMTALPIVASAHPTGAGARNPVRDAHIIQRPRGDIMVVQSEAGNVRAGVRAYVAPSRNSRYAAMRPGDRLRAAFYAPRYVVADPGLRPVAGANRRWVRYFDDLLLVDIRTGRVLRVMSRQFA